MIFVIMVVLLDSKPEWLCSTPENLVRCGPLVLSALLGLAWTCPKNVETGGRFFQPNKFFENLALNGYLGLAPLGSPVRAIAFGSDGRLHVMAQHPCLSFRPTPGHDPGESRNPVTKAMCAFTRVVDYWVPARASPVEPGSLGRDDGPQ